MANSVCCSPCIGSGATLSGANATTELIKVNLCQPLRQACGTGPTPIFFSGALPAINGIFTVSNSGTLCDITVNVTDANGTAVPYLVAPQSSVAVAVDDVTSITYTCSGAAPDFCTGAFEANFNYCVSC